MKKFGAMLAGAALACWALVVFSQSNLPLKLVQTILLAKVEGGIDHMGVDVKGEP